MPWRLFEFTRMPFGLHGATASFQRLMDNILAPHTRYAAAYIDDIVIYSQSWKHHLQRVEAVLWEIHHFNMMANPKKCSLGMGETNYLGFHVGKGLIHPLANEVKIIEKYRPPQTKK